MSDRWSTKVECCGNCAFWPLHPTQNGIRDVPYGLGGNMCDGSASDCRRHAPTHIDDQIGWRAARWPQTKREDFCGDFELRG